MCKITSGKQVEKRKRLKGKIAATGLTGLVALALFLYYSGIASAVAATWAGSSYTTAGTSTISNPERIYSDDESKTNFSFNSTSSSLTVSGFSTTPPAGAKDSVIDSVVFNWDTDNALASGSSPSGAQRDSIVLQYLRFSGDSWQNQGSYTVGGLPGARTVTATTKNGINAWTWSDLSNVQMRISTAQQGTGPDGCTWMADAMYLTVNYTLDSTAPNFTISYFNSFNAGTGTFSDPLPADGSGYPLAKLGTVYMKIVTDDTMQSAPSVNITTPNNANNSSGTSTAVAGGNGKIYVYTWTIGSSDNDGISSVTVTGTNDAGLTRTNQTPAGNPANIDTTAPTLSLEYYSDSGLTTLLQNSGGKPFVKAGTVYVRLVSSETLTSVTGDHKLSISAPGTVNDVSAQNFTWDAVRSSWVYSWSVSSGNDGDATATVTAKDLVGNIATGAPSSGGTVTIDTVALQVELEYYSDSSLTTPLPTLAGKPVAKANAVYIRLRSADTLSSVSGDHKISIDAPATVNDVSNQNFTWDPVRSVWVYTWIVSSGSDGNTSSINVSSKDAAGNAFSGAPFAGNSATIDTIEPVLDLSFYRDSGLTQPVPVSGSYSMIKAGTVYVKLTGSEPLSPIAGNHKLTINAPGAANDLNNREFTWDETTNAWVFMWTINAGSDGNAESITVSGKDVAGNTRTGSPQSGNQITIDTTAPTLSLEYYTDPSLTIPLPTLAGKVLAGVQTVYIKLVSNENLSVDAGVHKITIDAPDSTNDVTSQSFIWDAVKGAWVYPWTISGPNAAYNGDTSLITVTGIDIALNTTTGTPFTGNVVTIKTMPEPTIITVSTSNTSIPNDNSTTSVITAHLHDQYGQHMSGVQINFVSTLAGSVLSAANALTNEDGNASVTIRSGTGGITTITGTVEDFPSVSDSANVTFYPPAQMLNMTVSLDNRPANNTSTAIVTAVATDGGGLALPDGTNVIFTISGGTGTFSDGSTIKAVPISGGLGRASAEVKSDNIGTVSVLAEAAGISNTADVHFIAQVISQISLSASPSSVKADGVEKSTLTATVKDQAEVAMGSGYNITFSTTLGVLSQSVKASNEEGQASVTLKSNSAGTATVSANYHALSDSVDIILEVPDNIPPSLLRAEPTSKQMLYLTFSEPVKLVPDPPASWNVYKYVDGNEYEVSFDTPEVLSGDKRIVKLPLIDEQDAGNAYPNTVRYRITVDDVYDMWDNVIDTVYSYAYWDAYTPHGKYSKVFATDVSNGTMCGQCHSAHSAEGQQLLSKETVKKICFVCHGVTGISVFKVEDEFTSRIANGSEVSYTLHKALDHDNPEGNDVLYCTDCHNPHGDRRTGNEIYPKLLKAVDVAGNAYYEGPDYCLACHGDSGKDYKTGYSMAAFYEATGGDHRWGMEVDGNKDIAGRPIPHYDFNFAVLNPASGTKATCLNCHDRHGSRYRSLLDNALTGEREEMCFKCHGDSANSMNNIDIQDKFSLSYKHDIFDPNNKGLTCSSCHGPHSVAGRRFADSSGSLPSAITDPENTKNNWYKSDGQDMAGFCNKCHDAESGVTITSVTSSTEIRPFTVSLLMRTFTSNAGGWNKKKYYDYSNAGSDNAEHYLEGMGCDVCHDPHGTNNPSLQIMREDGSSSGMCSRCHGGGTETPASDYNVYSQVNKAYSHIINTGTHLDTENLNSAGLTRHAECVDCHDPHAAKRSTSTSIAIPEVRESMKNMKGVNPSARAAGAAAGNWTLVDAQYEWQVCYKCHSNYSGSLGSRRDTAREFNPANLSFHFVEGSNSNTHDVPTYRGRDRNGNNWTYNSRMYCSDCHGVDVGSYNNEAAVKGVHGSANADILKGWWDPATGLAATQKFKTDYQSFLCFRCHNEDYYGGWKGTRTNGSHFVNNSGGGSLHSNRDEHRVPCWACHGRKVHGGSRTHLVSVESDEDAGSVFSVIDSYTHIAAGTYLKSNCTTSGGSVDCTQYYTYTEAVAGNH